MSSHVKFSSSLSLIQFVDDFICPSDKWGLVEDVEDGEGRLKVKLS